jgi:hypothetical protein
MFTTYLKCGIWKAGRGRKMKDVAFSKKDAGMIERRRVVYYIEHKGVS